MSSNPNVEQSTTTQPNQIEKVNKVDNKGKEGKNNGEKKYNRPQIDFSTLPETIEELEALISEIKKSQGKKPEILEKDKLITQIDKKINKEQEEITKLREKVYEKNSGNVGVLDDQLKQVKAEIDELNEKLDTIKAQEQTKRDRAQHAKEVVKKLIDAKQLFIQNNFLKGFDNEEKITNEIEKLNLEISTKHHSTKDEKNLISKIDKLESSIKLIPQLKIFDQNIETAIQQRTVFNDATKNNKEFEELKTKLNEKKQKRGELYERIKERKNQNQSEFDLFKEKKQNVKKLIEERKQINIRFSSVADKYHEDHRKITACEKKIELLKRKQEKEQKRKEFLERQAKRDAEKAKREEEEKLAREAEELEKKKQLEEQQESKRQEEEEKLRNPHKKEISEIKPLLIYLKNLQTNTGKRQKGKNIQHPVDKSILFSTLGVSIPKLLAEVPSVVDVLQKKLETYESKILDEKIPIEEVRKLRGVKESVSVEDKNETQESS